VGVGRQRLEGVAGGRNTARVGTLLLVSIEHE